MDWVENEELTNDRCSTASSVSNSGEINSSLSSQANGPKAVNNQNVNGNQVTQSNSNTSLNLDSMSDGELSDFSLNDSDDDEFRTTGNTGKALSDSFTFLIFSFYIDFCISRKNCHLRNANDAPFFDWSRSQLKCLISAFFY